MSSISKPLRINVMQLLVIFISGCARILKSMADEVPTPHTETLQVNPISLTGHDEELIACPPASDIGGLVKSLRGGRTQREFARLHGVRRQTVNDWEAGRVVPSPAHLAAMGITWEIDSRRSMGASPALSMAKG